MKNYFAENLKTLLSIHNIKEDSFFKDTGLPKKYFIDFSVDQALATAEYFDISIEKILTKDLSYLQNQYQKNIKLLILDIDGVMTDGGMYFTESGDQIKKYNTKDGMAIMHLRKNGFEIGIISSGFKSGMVKQRADMLKIDRVYVGREPKKKILEQWCKDLNISLKSVAYLGDDINDEEMMAQVGLAACPADAVPRIKKISHVIMDEKGGKGCVRTFIDQFLGHIAYK